MNRSSVCLAVLLYVLCISHGIAQQPNSSGAKQAADAPTVKPIPAAQIVERALETGLVPGFGSAAANGKSCGSNRDEVFGIDDASRPFMTQHVLR